jgi:hypothetical protein
VKGKVPEKSIDQIIACDLNSCLYFEGGESDFITQELGKAMNADPDNWMDFVSFT